jgi:uncharacterized protein DUF4838
MLNKIENLEFQKKRSEKKLTFFQKSNFKTLNYYLNVMLLFNMLILCSCQDLSNEDIKQKQGFEITKNGKSSAKIVIGENANHSALFAAKELQEHIQKITGATLPIVTDQEQRKGNRILVGDSEETRKLGYSNDDFKSQEFMIKTFPGTIVLMGRDKKTATPSRFKTLGGVEINKGKLGGSALAFNNGVLKVADCDFSDEKGSMECLVYLPDNAIGFIMSISGLRGYHRLYCENNKVVYAVAEQIREEFGGRGMAEISLITSPPLKKGWHRILATHDANSKEIKLFVDGKKIGEEEYIMSHIGTGGRLDIGGYYADYRYDYRANPCKINKSIWVSRPFNGKIEEVAVSENLREPSATYTNLPVAGNSLLLRFGVNNELCTDFSGNQRVVPPPFPYDEQGTAYAVHEFLEKSCGVRWYGPTELEMVFPETESLTVITKDIRRSPALRHRHVPDRPFLSNSILYNYPSIRDWNLFMSRLKAGGERYIACHGYMGYYDRFINKKSMWFEGEKNEIWAKREHQPKDWRFRQLCYNNSEAIEQMAKDGREYFNGEKYYYRITAAGDYFSVSPVDHQFFCECEKCRKEIADAPSGSLKGYGKHSNYVFGFVDKVAKKLKKTHPEKHVSAIAYQAYLDAPTHVQLEPDVAIQMCTDFQAMYRPGVKKRVMAIYNNWLKESQSSGRALYVTPYYNFPAVYVIGYCAKEKHYPFPVFIPHIIGETYKMFAKDGIKGFYNYGDPRQLGFYLMYKTADDPTLDVEGSISEFFQRYYGNAAKPMKGFFEEMEKAVCDPSNLPSSNAYSFSECTSWGTLGNAKRMEKLSSYMSEAEKAADTPETKQRVKLFQDAIWKYMLIGRENYQKKLLALCDDPKMAKKMLDKIDRMKAVSPPSVIVPYLKSEKNGKIDWSKTLKLKKWKKISGFPSVNKHIATQVAHDGKNLRIRITDDSKNMKLKMTKGKVWYGDVCELFFAPKPNSRPYQQLAISPTGEYKALSYPDNVVGVNDWHINAKIESETNQGGLWILEISLPLNQLVADGIKPGDSFYANFYRNDSEANLLAWSPNFVDTFHALDRLGKFTLAK